MQIKFLRRGPVLIIGITGELDHHSAEDIKEKIDSQLIKSSTGNVVFDFTKMDFMDSSGIGVILGRYKQIQKLNGKMALAGANDQIMKILEMSGLLKLVPVYDKVDSAIIKM